VPSGAGPQPLSARNGRVKAARKLLRRAVRADQRLFLAEGPQAVREALADPGCVHEVFALASAASAHPDLATAAENTGMPWHVVDDEALGSLTETVTPQGLVAVCDFVDVPLAIVLASEPALLAICADVRDPGNAGAVIRCADAAGAGGVVLAGSSVDPYNGKAVRASAGSLFHLPVVVSGDATGVVRTLQGRGVQVLAADAAGETDLDDALDQGLLTAPHAWLFGNEAHGLPESLAALADHRVRIRIRGGAESLNLATAAAICLHESARRR
jgi:RNA methyltransferase, TrmH family